MMTIATNANVCAAPMPKLAVRNRDWLQLKDELNWPYSRIARFVGKSVRTVKRAVEAARREQAVNAAARLNAEDVAEIIEYAQGHPLYRKHPEVQMWIRQHRAGR